MKVLNKKGQIITVTEEASKSRQVPNPENQNLYITEEIEQRTITIEYEVVADGNWHGNKEINYNTIVEALFEFEGVILRRLTTKEEGLLDVPRRRRRRATINAFKKYKFNK